MAAAAKVWRQEWEVLHLQSGNGEGTGSGITLEDVKAHP